MRIDSQIHLQSIFDHSPVAHFVYCGDRFVYVNSVFIQLLGYPEVDMYADDFLNSIVLPVYYPILQRMRQRWRKGKAIRSGYRIPLIRKDRQHIHVDVFTKSVSLNERQTIIGTVLDVTAGVQLDSTRMKNHQLLKQSHKIAGIASWQYDMIDRKTFWSDEIYDMLGMDRAIEPSLKPLQTFLHPHDVEKVRIATHGALSGQPYDVEFRLLLPNQKERTIHSVASVEFDSKGRPARIIGVLQDVTRQKTIERQLRVSQQRYASLFQNSPNLVCSLDLAGRIVDVNPTFLNKTEYTHEELVGTHYSKYLDPLDFQSNKHIFKQVLNGESILYQAAGLTKSGMKIDLEINTLPILVDEEIVGMFGIARDISIEKQSNRLLEQSEQRYRSLAYQDPLTGLPNRRMFMEQLELLLALSQESEDPLSVLFVDLDRLKTVNDSLGHAVGDSLIQQVANRLQECIRTGDTLARLGGDEFAILLPDLSSLEDPIVVAKRVLASFHKPILLQNRDFYTSASIGIAYSPDHGTDVATLMRNADTAMYQVKNNGKNDFRVYQADFGNQHKKRFDLETALYEALQKREFILHYQPRMQTQTNCLIGVEALIRWNHPELGLVPPLDFIPIAEETGLIVPIGEWVLQEACRQIRIWRQEGFPFVRVSINVSARQFQRSNVYETVLSVLKKAELDPQCLEIEITEGTLMQNEASIRETLQKLMDIGIHVSIDDFGTGYSSMSYLKQFKLKTLKIDRSFIQGVPHHLDNAAISRALIGLAHSLNMRVVAEGVESEEEYQFLLQNHSDEVQGFYISPPVSAADLTHLVHDLQKKSVNMN